MNDEEGAPVAHCAECFDTSLTDLFFLKLLANPGRLYISARVENDPCPYCFPFDEFDDTSHYSF